MAEVRANGIVAERENGRFIDPLEWRGAPPGNLNWNKVLVVTGIGLLLLGPVVAVAASGQIPLSERGVFQYTSTSSNGTSAPTAAYYPLTAALANYVYHGDTTSEKNLSEINPLLEQAAEQEHPLERARHFHDARIALQSDNENDERIEKILHEEILALQEAADAAPTLGDKIVLIRRGVKELQEFRPQAKSHLGCLRDNNPDRCFDSVSLWNQAARIHVELAEQPWQKRSPFRFPDLDPHNFRDPLYLASQCKCQAALSLRGSQALDVQEERCMYIEQAIQYQHRIDTSDWSTENKALLCEEMANTYDIGWRLVLDAPQQVAIYVKGVVEETLNAHKLYVQLAHEKGDYTTYYRIKAAQQLMYAGNYVESLSQKLGHYKQALSVAQKAWDDDKVGCLDNSFFTFRGKYKSNFYEENLLQYLTSNIKKMEVALIQEQSIPIIYRIGRGISDWFRR